MKRKIRGKHVGDIREELKCDHEPRDDCPRCLRRQGLVSLHLAACADCRNKYKEYREEKNAVEKEFEKVQTITNSLAYNMGSLLDRDDENRAIEELRKMRSDWPKVKDSEWMQLACRFLSYAIENA